MKAWGRNVYGIACFSLGAVALWWRDFATVWQPVPEDLPGRMTLAWIVAAAFVLCGAALQSRRTAAPSSVVAATLFAVFTLLWVRRIVHYPGIVATWAGSAEELAQALGGVLIFIDTRTSRPGLERAKAACIVAFGLCAVSFGLLHFEAIPQTAAMVPAWLPPGTRFWAVATGVFHIAGGLALVAGVLERPAAWLLTAMFAGFGLLVWLPNLLAQPGDHMAWAGNAVNLALVAAAWVVADHAGARRSLPRLVEWTRALARQRRRGCGMNEGRAYALRWIDAWNSGSLDRALALWADEMTFSSPLAAEITGAATLHGKAAVADYWQRALAQSTHLRFELLDAFWDHDARTVTILYRRERGDDVRLAAEIIRLNGEGLGDRGVALHGAPQD